ncbi:MAG: hypothetical protein ACK5W0_08360 [Labrys sp. (in: a-proteobacteria)]
MTPHPTPLPNPWRPIEEHDGTRDPVLITGGDAPFWDDPHDALPWFVAANRIDDMWFIAGTITEYCNPTHFAPLSCLPAPADALKPDQLPDWAQWKGAGEMPASWFATNPETGALTKIYRSYEDFVDD